MTTQTLVEDLKDIALDLWQSSETVAYGKRLDAAIEALESALSAQAAQQDAPQNHLVAAPTFSWPKAPPEQPTWTIDPDYLGKLKQSSDDEWMPDLEGVQAVLLALSKALVAAPVPLPSEQHGPSWVSVKDRLPKERGTYMVFHPDYPEQVRIVNFGTSTKWENGRDKARPAANRITHWMPLPAAPTDSASPSAALQGEMIAATKDVQDAPQRYFPFEFEVWQGQEMCASASGPRDMALSEALHYAAQYGQDGPVRIFEVRRELVKSAAPVSPISTPLDSVAVPSQHSADQQK